MSFYTPSYPASHPDPTVSHLLASSGAEQLRLSRQAAVRYEQTQALRDLRHAGRARPSTS